MHNAVDFVPRPVVWHSALVDETKEETPEEKEAPCGLCAGSPEKKEDVSGEVGRP